MRTYKTLTLIIAICFSANVNAQFWKKLKDKAAEAAERTVERKVEEKTERETEKSFDSIFNNQGKLFKGKASEPMEAYTFSHAYQMDIISGKDTTQVTYYLTNTHEYLGSSIQMKENEQMIMVLDLPRKSAYSFMDFGGNKSMISFPMDFEKLADNQATKDDIVIEATGNSKDILGYPSEEYQVEGHDFKGTIWVTQEADISFSDAFNATKTNNKGKNTVNQAWLNMVEGLTLEMNMVDTSKKKHKNIKMHCTALNPTDFSIYSSEFAKTF